MTTVRRPDAHVYDPEILNEIREDFDIILSSERLRENSSFWDPDLGYDDAAAGVGGALTTEVVARVLEARARRASTRGATELDLYEQRLKDALAEDGAVKSAQESLRSAQDAEARARTALDEAQKAEAEARNAWNEDAQTKLNQTEDAITQKNRAIENAERIHEATKIPVVDQEAVDAKASELAEARQNLENLQKGGVDAEAVRNAEAQLASAEEALTNARAEAVRGINSEIANVDNELSRVSTEIRKRSGLNESQLRAQVTGYDVDLRLLNGTQQTALLRELSFDNQAAAQAEANRLSQASEFKHPQRGRNARTYRMFEYKVVQKNGVYRIQQVLSEDLKGNTNLREIAQERIKTQLSDAQSKLTSCQERATLEQRKTALEAERKVLEERLRTAENSEAVKNAESKVTRLRAELENLRKGTVNPETVRNAEARVNELKSERTALEVERTRLNALKTNAEAAAARTSTATAELETARKNVAECETKFKTATENVRNSVRGTYSETELRRIDSARGGKGTPTEVAREVSSKWGRGLKIGGRILGGAAVGLFLYHCYEYATDDPQFMKIDEEGQKILVDPTALSGADASKKQVLFQGENDRIATFMAMYATEYGLAGVPQYDWANYLVNMGTGQVFTLDSEVELRCTLLRAYQAMSDEEKIRFCDHLIAQNQNNPAFVESLQILKTGIQSSGNGNVRPADTRTRTSTPATPTDNVAPRPAETSPQTDNVAPRPATPTGGRRRVKIPYSSNVTPAPRVGVAPTADATRGLAGAQRITVEGAEVDLTRTPDNSRNA